jgi:guanylate kinase
MIDDDTEGKMVVVVAPSGSGKTTMAKRLLTDFPKLQFSVSATTRDAREGETNGREYYFMSDEQFDKYIDDGAFLEWEMFYNGKRYGTLKPEVDRLLKKGYFVLLDLEVKGAMNVKKLYGNRCLAVFIQPPSLEILRDRLLKRGTESDESLKLRLDRVAFEMEYRDSFDITVVNDDLERAYSEIFESVNRFLNDTSSTT